MRALAKKKNLGYFFQFKVTLVHTNKGMNVS